MNLKPAIPRPLSPAERLHVQPALAALQQALNTSLEADYWLLQAERHIADTWKCVARRQNKSKP